MTTALDLSKPSAKPLIDPESCSRELEALHARLTERGYLSLERYPLSGSARHLYNDPGVFWRYLVGGSNSWDTSALSGFYYGMLRRGSSALWTLFRAFLLCEPVGAAELQQALGPEMCQSLERSDILVRHGDQLESLVRATPWQGSLFLHDSPPAFRESFVFLGADSLTFARHLQRWHKQQGSPRISRVLDLCTGSGIHALMLAPHADAVFGADINPRAIEFARLNTRLQRRGNASFAVSDLFNSVPRGAFDLIVSNTPFLFLPEELRGRCVDGNGGLLGIELVLRLVDGAIERTAPGGTVILHANSPIVGGRDRLVEALQERFQGLAWTVTCTPTHAFYDPQFDGLYRRYGIDRFVTYVIVLKADGGPFRLRLGRLSPARRAACGIRIAGARSQASRKEDLVT